jgi:penicillin-binding protein 1C
MWHKWIHLDKNQQFRVSDGCYPVSEMVHKSWFVLPPAIEFYYRQKNPSYSLLPPLLKGCSDEVENLEFIYPREWNNLFIPTDLDGTPGKLIFELAHRQKSATVFWSLDNSFLATTSGFHQVAIHPEPGWHIVSVSDNLGNQLTRQFLVQEKELH